MSAPRAATRHRPGGAASARCNIRETFTLLLQLTRHLNAVIKSYLNSLLDFSANAYNTSCLLFNIVSFLSPLTIFAFIVRYRHVKITCNLKIFMFASRSLTAQSDTASDFNHAIYDAQ